MQVYNTLERAVVPFVPSNDGVVTMYVCGPTVQSQPHLGHGRSAVAFDVLRRYLTWIGYDVSFVRNVTDVDDKIIKRAEELGLTTDEVAAVAFAEFTEAYDKLGNLRPTIEPKATDSIDGMIEIIETLIDRGNAYESDGDVYFAVRSFDGYGKLSRHDLDDLRSGERIEPDPRKRDPLDFAMWKSAKPGEPNWPSPWGPGRPGWHIECSAMAAEFLGPAFDIHGGGTDLIFPHHENEIAQSEAATDVPFARYWMHNGMLNLSGEKMAKSTGHVVTLLESLDRWDPLAIRLFYLRTHYRKPLEFSAEALADAEASLGRLRAFRRRAPTDVEGASDAASVEAFTAAMDNDLDAAGALGVVFDVVRSANGMMDRGEDVEALVRSFDEMMQVLGLDAHTEGAPLDVSNIGSAFGIEGASIEDLLDLRIAAREARDWARSDAIRDGLASVGIVIEDTADGTRWHRD